MRIPPFIDWLLFVVYISCPALERIFRLNTGQTNIEVERRYLRPVSRAMKYRKAVSVQAELPIHVIKFYKFNILDA